MSPRRGMRSFGDHPRQGGSSRWDEDIVKLDPPKVGRPVLIRPCAGILTVGVHYFKFLTKEGKESGFYTLCPNWNLEEQVEQENGCPICENFHRHIPVQTKKDEYLKMPLKYRYLFHAFNVSSIMQGETDPAQIFAVVETHALGMKAIEKAMLHKNAKADDPKHGFCLSWLLTKSENTQYGDTEVDFSHGDSMEVRPGKKDGQWLIRVQGKVYSGVEQDLFAVIPPPPTSQELDRKLVSFKLYDALARATGQSRAASTGGDAGNESMPAGAPPAEDTGGFEDSGSDDAGAAWEDTATAAPEGPDAPDWPDDGDNGVAPSTAAAAAEPAASDDSWEALSGADDSSAPGSDDSWDAQVAAPPEAPATESSAPSSVDIGFDNW